MNASSNTCPVCGFPELMAAPRAPSGGGSYEICPACGYQFGVDDDDRGISHEKWRAEWIAEGMPWKSVGVRKPVDWEPAKLLGGLG